MNINHPVRLIAALICSGLLFFSNAQALDSDKNAPVTINADTTSIDFRTGKRVLTGNVDISQGTLNIKADKVVLVYNGDDIKTATAYGKPVKFKQLPEGQTEIVHGRGKTLKLTPAKNLITVKENAKITQGSNTITGKVIHYNTHTSKMTVKGQSSASQKSGSKKAKSDKAAVSKKESGRTRIVIQPGTLKK